MKKAGRLTSSRRTAAPEPVPIRGGRFFSFFPRFGGAGLQRAFGVSVAAVLGDRETVSARVDVGFARATRIRDFEIEELDMGKKVCARCGKNLAPMNGLYASVWSSDRGEVFYCHDDEGDCYGPATWAGCPELGHRDD